MYNETTYGRRHDKFNIMHFSYLSMHFQCLYFSLNGLLSRFHAYKIQSVFSILYDRSPHIVWNHLLF